MAVAYEDTCPGCLIIFFKDFSVCFMCMSIACMCICAHMCAWCPQRSEEGVRTLELELHHVVLGLLQEQQMFLTTEPSLQPSHPTLGVFANSCWSCS